MLFSPKGRTMNDKDNKNIFLLDKLIFSYWFFRLLIVFSLVVIPRYCFTQDLFNAGNINNKGTFRVKERAEGLKDSINGVFDYFGKDQIVSAVQYDNLMLTGSGIKITVGGNFSVKNNVTIAQDVILSVETGYSIELGGELFEQGYLTGSIQKEVDLDGSVDSSNFGNIGATIVRHGIAPGKTLVTRTSGSVQNGNGFESILRYYDVRSTINHNLNVDLIFKYSDNELNGHDPHKLLLWKSVDAGKTWKIQRSIRNTSNRSITKLGVSSFGRFTFSDSLHPLGSIKESFGILAIYSGNDQSQPINSTLQPFIVTLKDSDGTPLVGETVRFEIIESPNNAIGQKLSDTVVLTDVNGFASSMLTLGSKVGTYSVGTYIMDDPDNKLIFNAKAYTGAISSIEQTLGNNQTRDIGTSLPFPFVVTVVDAGGNPIPNVNVSFTISDTPQYAQGQHLTNVLATTDSLGQASTWFKLGSMYGRYRITAYIQIDNSKSVTFDAYATAFLADANGDHYANIADLTTVFDKILGKIELTPENFTRADVDSNHTIDVRDAVIILGGILKGRWDSISSDLYKTISGSDQYKCEFEITKKGLRFNVSNNQQIKGIQIALRLNNEVNFKDTIEMFNRVKYMQIPIDKVGNIVRVVVYNNDNMPIENGKGSIFRLPYSNLHLEDFDVLYVMVSTNSNEGIYIPSEKVIAPSDKYPATFVLEQNYPNPFNSNTRINFHVPDDGNILMPIELTLFDLSGKKVRTLINGNFEPGVYTCIWDGTDDKGVIVSSGMYIYRLSSNENRFVKNMMFVK